MFLEFFTYLNEEIYADAISKYNDLLFIILL